MTTTGTAVPGAGLVPVPEEGPGLVPDPVDLLLAFENQHQTDLSWNIYNHT